MTRRGDATMFSASHQRVCAHVCTRVHSAVCTQHCASTQALATNRPLGHTARRASAMTLEHLPARCFPCASQPPLATQALASNSWQTAMFRPIASGATTQRFPPVAGWPTALPAPRVRLPTTSRLHAEMPVSVFCACACGRDSSGSPSWLVCDIYHGMHVHEAGCRPL